MQVPLVYLQGVFHRPRGPLGLLNISMHHKLRPLFPLTDHPDHTLDEPLSVRKIEKKHSVLLTVSMVAVLREKTPPTVSLGE